MPQLSAWQDYVANKLYLQQISIPLTVRNNIRILPRKTGILTLTLQPNKTSFTPRHTIIGKGIAYVKPLDQDLPLRPIEIEFENNRCCITPYYGSATYHYLRMGMGMSVSPQIWQQFVVLIKCKQNFDIIMDDTFIHSTAEEHMDDLIDLFKVLRKYGLKLSPHKCQFFKKKIVYMGLEFQIQEDKVAIPH